MLPYPALRTHPQLTSETFFENASELLESFKIVLESTSVQGRPIRAFARGTGPIRILLWTQMHGDESTSTFALADWLYAMQINPDYDIWERITLWIIPILNPDGAKAYTRFNALGVDLNRDARHQICPESRFLIECADALKPQWVFNMHDQRSIFGVGATGKSATLALLAPSLPPNYTGSVLHRRRAIALIGSVVSRMTDEEQSETARFDDTFYPLAMGDYFQEREAATILVETGGGRDIIRHVGRMRTAKFLKEALDVLQNPSECIWRDAPSAYEALEENTNNLRDVIFYGGQVGEHKIDLAVQLSYNPVNQVWETICDTVGHLEYLHSSHRIDVSESTPIKIDDWNMVVGKRCQIPAAWMNIWKTKNISSYAWVNPN